LNGALRRTQITGPLSGLCKNIVVTEYPKSGGTWLSQMLAEATSVPYPRNRLPMMMKKSIAHGCYLDISLKNRTVVLMRDGRDVMVSYYFHLVMYNNLKSTQHVNKVRKYLNFDNYDDSVANLPTFIEYCYSGQVFPRFTWSEFVNKWMSSDDVVHTSYEKLQSDTVGELKKVVTKLGYQVNEDDVTRAVNKFKFDKVSKSEEAVAENSRFTRKGIVGDWVNHFSDEAVEVFDHYAGAELAVSGYV